MAYELINNGGSTPNRVRGLLRALARVEDLTVEAAIKLIQPTAGDREGSAARTVLDSVIKLKLVSESSGVLKLKVRPEEIESIGSFRRLLQITILRNTRQNQSNSLLNAFSAWYISRNEQVFQSKQSELDVPFNTRIFPDSESRHMNSTKITAWRNWAAFLGFGTLGRFGASTILIPNTRGAISYAMAESEYLKRVKKPVLIGRFIDEIGEICPELDGGKLYRQVFSKLGSSSRPNQITMATSTALRALESGNALKLSHVKDSAETWSLYPDSNDVRERISHVKL